MCSSIPIRQSLQSWFERFSSPLPTDASSEAIQQARTSHRQTLARADTCVEFHRPRFHRLGIRDERDILAHLDAARVVSLGKSPRLAAVETGVLGDIVLAQRCLLHDPRATREFLRRYDSRIQRWAKSKQFDLDGDFSLWTFFAVERANAPARLACYRGWTSLWCYLDRCLRRELSRQQDKRRREEELLRMQRERFAATTSVPIDDAEVVIRTIRTTLAQLTREEQALLFWTIDERPREEPARKDHERTLSKLGQILGRSVGYLSRQRELFRVETSPRLLSRACQREGTSLDELASIVFRPDRSKDAVLEVLGTWLRTQEISLSNSQHEFGSPSAR